MRTDLSSGSALAPALWPASVHPWIRNVILVLLGTGILTLSAKTSVQFWPVPMTLQTFALMFIAAAYGRWLAVATVAAYLFEGFIGLPVFATTPPLAAGPAYFLGTTGGFLIGFLAIAFIVGWAADRGWDRSVVKLGLAMLLADAVTFLLGFVWLAWFAAGAADIAGTTNVLGLTFDYTREVTGEIGTGVGASTAWTYGVAHFLLADGLKIAIAALLIPAGWTLLNRSRRP